MMSRGAEQLLLVWLLAYVFCSEGELQNCSGTHSATTIAKTTLVTVKESLTETSAEEI